MKRGERLTELCDCPADEVAGMPLFVANARTVNRLALRGSRVARQALYVRRSYTLVLAAVECLQEARERELADCRCRGLCECLIGGEYERVAEYAQKVKDAHDRMRELFLLDNIANKHDRRKS